MEVEITMFKRLALILAVVALATTQFQPQVAQAEEVSYKLAFHVEFVDGREPYTGDVLWILNGEGSPIVVRPTGEGMVQVGYHGNFAEGYIADEFTFLDSETGEMASASLEGNSFIIAPHADPSQAYHTPVATIADWNGELLFVSLTYISGPPAIPGLGCVHWQGTYSDGSVGRAQAIPFVDASGQRYRAAVLNNNEFLIAPNGSLANAFVSPNLIYFDPSAAHDVTVSAYDVVTGGALPLIMQDWDGTYFNATTIDCYSFPIPFQKPARGGGWN